MEGKEKWLAMGVLQQVVTLGEYRVVVRGNAKGQGQGLGQGQAQA